MPLSRRYLLVTLAAALAVPAMTGEALAQTAPVYAEGGVAVDGTDVVAYFTEGRAVAGDPEIVHTWRGATWRFSSTENRDAFAANPESYAPQFGGYCAWAVSNGYTASTVPEAWRIVDGRLYLNYSKRIQRRWERDIPGRIAAAQANWPDLLK